MDEARNRYLRDRVMTASPAQRVVMIYDRLALDLRRAREAETGLAAGEHLGHASGIVAELLTSLDLSAGGPADNLGQLYGFLINELTAIRVSDERVRLDPLIEMVTGLREAFSVAAASVAATASRTAATSRTAVAALAGSSGSAGSAPAPAAWVG